MTPSPSPEHQIILGNIVEKFREFAKDKGMIIFSPVDVYLDEENAYQPDLVFISKQRREIIRKDGIYGPPDLVVEVLSPSTAHYDLREKFRVYERTGVKEYWIVDPDVKMIEVYTNEADKFTLFSKAEGKGEVNSSLLEGFEITIEDIFTS